MQKLWSKKSIFIMIIFTNIIAILLGFSLFSVATGKANIVLNGIAVDSKGVVYIGYDKSIEVYNESKFIKKIPIPTSRGYEFTIDDDNIVFFTGEYIYLLSLDGKVIDKKLDSYENHVYSKNTFKSESGDVYKIESVLLKTKVIKNNNEIMYQISDRDLIAKIFFEISVLSVAILIVPEIKDDVVLIKQLVGYFINDFLIQRCKPPLSKFFPWGSPHLQSDILL